MKGDYSKKKVKIYRMNDLYADYKLIKHMHKVALQHLKANYPNNKDGYRFGFHRPPKNSKYHLHLHCIVLPLKNPAHEVPYGFMLTKVEDVLGILEKAIALC